MQTPSRNLHAGGHCRSVDVALTGTGWPSLCAASCWDCPGNVASGTHVLAWPGLRAATRALGTRTSPSPPALRGRGGRGCLNSSFRPHFRM